MIVEHKKTETLTIQLDPPDGLGPIEVKPIAGGAVAFLMKGGWLWAKPSDDGPPHFGYCQTQAATDCPECIESEKISK